MLLGDGHVEIALRKFLRVFDQAGTFAHGRGDADDALVARCHVAQPLAKDLRVGGPGGFFLEDGAADRIERARAVPLDRILLGRVVAFALAA